MDKFIYIILALLFLACAEEPTPEQIVRNYIDAQNGHIISEKLEDIDEKTIFQIPGSGTSLTGIDEIKKRSQYDSVLNTQLTIISLIADGNTIICGVIENNLWLETAGLPPMAYDSSIFYVIGGKIRKIIAYPDDTSMYLMSSTFNNFTDWLIKERFEAAREMMPDGEFQYSAQNARRILSLLRDWRNSDSLEN